MHALETVVEEVVHVTGKDRLDIRLGSEVQKPGSTGLGVIVVVIGFIRRIDKRWIMAEQQLCRRIALVQFLFKPDALNLLGLAPCINERCIHADNVDITLPEGVELWADGLFIGSDVVVIHGSGRHQFRGLVTDVMITGDEMKRWPKRCEEPMRLFCCRLGFGHMRQGMDHVAEVDGEVRLARSDHAHRKRRARIGFQVHRKG